MPPDEPGWWYTDEATALGRARLLAPVGRLYGRMAEARFRRARPYRSPLPVICIGNFTAGGTGKTPLSLLAARHLIARGEQPVFLTRGYGGRTRGPMWLDATRDTAETAGDEPLLLAAVAPAMIARDRLAGIKAIEQGGVAATVVVMDDGLQNPALAKNLTIAVVDGRRGLGNGEVMPAGPLRAGLSFQLGLTDAIVVNGRAADGAPHPVLDDLRRAFPGPVLEARARPVGDTAWLKGATVLAFAGIASPERFFTLLEEQGATIAGRRVYPDHHAFSEDDAARLMAEATSLQATLVTTEKDWVRISAAGGRRRALREAARTLPIRLVLDEREEARLAGLIDGALAKARARA